MTAPKLGVKMSYSCWADVLIVGHIAEDERCAAHRYNTAAAFRGPSQNETGTETGFAQVTLGIHLARRFPIILAQIHVHLSPLISLYVSISTRTALHLDR